MATNLKYVRISLEKANLVYESLPVRNRSGEDTLLLHLNDLIEKNKKKSGLSFEEQMKINVDIFSKASGSERSELLKEHSKKMRERREEKKRAYEVIGKGAFGSVKKVNFGESSFIRKKCLIKQSDRYNLFAIEAYSLLKFYKPLKNVLYLGFARTVKESKNECVYFYLPVVGLDTLNQLFFKEYIKIKTNVGKYTKLNIKSLVNDIIRLHEAGIAHVDINPDNILILSRSEGTDGNDLELIDYGLSRIDIGNEKKDFIIKCGTPGYLPYTGYAKPPLFYSVDLSNFYEAFVLILKTRSDRFKISGSFINSIYRVQDLYALWITLDRTLGGEFQDKQPEIDAVIDPNQRQEICKILKKNFCDLDIKIQNSLRDKEKLLKIQDAFSSFYARVKVELKNYVRNNSEPQVPVIMNFKPSRSSSNLHEESKSSIHRKNASISNRLDNYSSINQNRLLATQYKKFLKTEVLLSSKFNKRVKSWNRNSKKRILMEAFNNLLNLIDDPNIIDNEGLFYDICRIAIQRRWSGLGKETNTGRYLLNKINNVSDYNLIKKQFPIKQPTNKKNQKTDQKVSYDLFISEIKKRTESDNALGNFNRSGVPYQKFFTASNNPALGKVLNAMNEIHNNSLT